MDIVLLLAVIGTGVTVIAFMYTFVRNFKLDMKSNITDMKTDIVRLHEDHQKAILRIDHLYTVIIDMLKKDLKK